MEKKVDILIIDPYPIATYGFQLLFREIAEVRIAARSLAEASAMVKERRPNVVILDLKFGLSDACAWVRGLGLRAIVTGEEISQSAATILARANIAGIFRKTLETVSIQSCVEAVLNGRNWVDPSLIDRRAEWTQDFELPKLGRAECAVLQLLLQGTKTDEIIKAVRSSDSSIRRRIQKIFAAYGVKNRESLVLAHHLLRDPNDIPPWE